MQGSGIPEDGSRPLEVGVWCGLHPMLTICQGHAPCWRRKGKVADGAVTEWTGTSVPGAYSRRKGHRDAPEARHDT